VLTGKRLCILISANKGLCGGLNSTLFRFVASHYPEMNSEVWVTAGQKEQFVSAMNGSLDFSSQATFIFGSCIADLATAVLSGRVDRVELVYNDLYLY
jgi:F0F1-type ATP synthase gamma subunit